MSGIWESSGGSKEPIAQAPHNVTLTNLPSMGYVQAVQVLHVLFLLRHQHPPRCCERLTEHLLIRTPRRCHRSRAHGEAVVQ